MFDVPLKDILDIVLKVNVGAYSFEAANPRHEHEVASVEDSETASRQVDYARCCHTFNKCRRASRSLVSERLAALRRLCWERKCYRGHRLRLFPKPARRTCAPLDKVRAKLKTLSEGAQLASNILWGRRTAA